MGARQLPADGWAARTWAGLWAQWASPTLARTSGCSREDDGSKRLVGTSFDEDLRQGKLTFFEYNEQMELLYRTTAELPVRQPLSGADRQDPHTLCMSTADRQLSRGAAVSQ